VKARWWVLPTLVGLLLVVWLAHSRGWGPLSAPAEHHATNVSPNAGGRVAGSGLDINVPVGAVSTPTALTFDAVDDSSQPSFAAAHGRRFDIRVDHRLRHRATLTFDLPRDRQAEQRFFVLRRPAPQAAWEVARGRLDGGAYVVRTARFSDWRLASWSPSGLRKRAGGFIDPTVDTRIDEPDCPNVPAGVSVEVSPASDPAVFACLVGQGDGYELTLHSNRAVGLSVAVPDGWRVTSIYGRSLGEALSDALTQAARSAPGTAGNGGRIALLPSTGQLVLEASRPRSAVFGVSVDNAGATLDLVLAFLAKARFGKATESQQRQRAQAMDAVECLYDAQEVLRRPEVDDSVRAVLRCLTVVNDMPRLAKVLLLGEIVKGAAAQVESVKDSFDGSSSPQVTVRFGDDEPEPRPAKPAPRVRRPAPPRPDARRAGFPSCAEYNQLSGSDADLTLRRLIERYEDESSTSLSVARLSVAAFCRLNPGRSIAGVYGGGSQGTTPATSVPACAEFLRLDDEQADAVLDLIATQHNDDSPISTRRLSASAFCQLYPGRGVDGIYGGSG
jgi:hypothetical protein